MQYNIACKGHLVMLHIMLTYLYDIVIALLREEVYIILSLSLSTECGIWVYGLV